MSKIILKTIFLFFLSSCADDTIQSNLTGGSNNINNLDVITWNLQNFPKNSQTQSQLVALINQLEGIDIIALQEIESSIHLNSIASSLGENWIAYRYENSDYGELSYLINIDTVDFQIPYSILNGQEYFFAYRPPYVLEFTFNNKLFVLINIHFKCCDDSNQDSYRREQASILLHNYIQNNFNNDNVIVVGDFNDDLIDSNNVFEVFLNDSENYLFADFPMAEQSAYWDYWSFPTWPSHLDHILITSELFDEYNIDDSYCRTLLMDDYFLDWDQYDLYISDHRPVILSININ